MFIFAGDRLCTIQVKRKLNGWPEETSWKDSSLEPTRDQGMDSEHGEFKRPASKAGPEFGRYADEWNCSKAKVVEYQREQRLVDPSDGRF